TWILKLRLKYQFTPMPASRASRADAFGSARRVAVVPANAESLIVCTPYRATSSTAPIPGPLSEYVLRGLGLWNDASSPVITQKTFTCQARLSKSCWRLVARETF